MCGIAGIVNLGPHEPPRQEELSAMIHALAHRGPDDFGFYAQPDVGLAHARLSIIDLSGGNQPIYNEDKTLSVVFNGEIFNYVELTEELIKQGHSFYTHSDTEVIVHAYEQYGLDFCEHFNGQFAFALWDTKKRRLVLARDRVGIRPMFYTKAGGRLLFASEIKSLLAVPEVERRLDLKGLGETFTFWSPLESRTLFEGIYQLPAGHVMTVDALDGRTSARRYWDWSFPDGAPAEDHSADEYAEELRALLIDSVRLQLRSDVPVGAYLSGGLDSSIITALIKHYTGSPLKTFSLSFEDPEFDESAFQRELADHLGTRYTQVTCRRSDIREAFPRTIWHTETALVRTGPTPLMLLSGKVRSEGYKVVLTGEGSDEVFGGYDIFREARIRRFWARQPDSKVRPLLLDRIYPYLKTSPISARAFAQGFFRQGFDEPDAPYFGHLPRWTTTRRTWELFSEDTAAALAAYDPIEAVREILPAEIGDWLPSNRDQYIEAHTLLTGYLLSSQGDRMAMANSIEGRYPFLDHRVIEFANRLPIRYKIMGLQEKYLLKRSMKHLLPRAVWERTKQPYRAPDSESFFENGEPADYVGDLLSPSRIKDAGYFDPAAVSRLFEKSRRGKAIGFADNMAFVGVLSTMLVHDLFVEARRPAVGAAAPVSAQGA